MSELTKDQCYAEAVKEISQLTIELDKLRCAYANVCDNAARTEKERDTLRARAEAAEAKCAEMREKINEAFAAAWTNDDVEDGNYYVPTVIMLDLKQLAQSDQCGAGWLSPEQAGRLGEALTNLIARVEYVRQHRFGESDPVGTRLIAISDLVDESYRAKQSLAATQPEIK